MTAQDLVRCVLKSEIGPALRRAGFKGTPPTWTLTAPSGDTAVVNVQSSMYNSASRAKFVVNLAVIPVEWWTHRDFGPLPMKTPKERHGLWRDRLHPSWSDPLRNEWWEVGDDHSARLAAEDAVQRLESVGIPKLKKLLNRDELIASIRRQDLGFARGPNHQGLFEIALSVLEGEASAQGRGSLPR